MRRAPRALRPRPVRCAGPSPRVAHTRTPIYETRAAHKGLIPALVCDAALPDSGPCVRHREGRAVTGHAPRPAGAEGGVCADARYWHRRALLSPARVISPSRCQRPPRGVDNARRRPARVRTPALPGAHRRRPRGASAAPRPPRWRALVEPVGGADRALPRARPSRVRRRRPRGPPRRARRRSAPVLPGARRRRPRGPLLATGSSGPHSRIRRAC